MFPDSDYFDDLTKLLVQVSTDVANLKQRVFFLEAPRQAQAQEQERQRQQAENFLLAVNNDFDAAYEEDENDRLTGRISQ